MITGIRLQNFRSYKDASFEFEPGVNIVIGPNASGKSNLLEAVAVLARGSSYRARDMELVKFSKEWSRLDGDFENQSRAVKINFSDSQTAKSFLIDNKPYKRLGLERTAPAVLFEPNHLQLLIRGPEQRRDYFDELLERSRPAFKPVATGYRRALAQRNALLKHGQARAANQLFVWNVRLSELGSQIAAARQELVDDINRRLTKDYSKIAGRRSKAELNYASHFPANVYASKLLYKLEQTAARDFERGFTGHGPHREEFIFYLNGQPAAGSASRGETRSLLLALKLYELDLIEKARGAKPIFLLDDVFSELDGARRRSLVDTLKNRQSIITTTDAEAVLEYFSESHRLIPL